MKRSYKLPLIVTFFHLPILFLSFTPKEKQKAPRKKIQISTIHLLEEQNPSAQPIQREQKATPPKPKQKRVVKKQPPKRKVVKKAPPKQKKVASKKKIKKNIAKSLSKRRVASKPNTKGKKTAVKKSTKKDAGKEKSLYTAYLNEVAEILQSTLTLPENGKVKLQLTASSGGRIVKIKSLLVESSANLTYLEEHLTGLSLPKYTKQEDRTFTIVFSDEK